MKTNATLSLFCTTFGHNYFRLNKATLNTPELICKCCKNYFRFDLNGNIVKVNQDQKQNIFFISKTKKIV